MDTLKIIKEKIEVLSSLVPDGGLQAVVRHIEIAEAHFSQARAKRDGDIFTDVIYRTNHAFEGILKEAYAIFAAKNPEHKTPYEIEQYLSDNNIFRPRVTDLFTNYRTQWRNPSTHDYQLTFTEAEAFLGILSVTSFVNLLLDQMIQQAAYDREKLDTEQHALEIRKHIKSIESLPLLDRTVQLLLEFSRQLRKLDPKSAGTNESQLSGMLHAFLTSFAPEIDVAVQPMLKDASGRISPDFILSQAGDGVLIEVTKYKRLNKKSEELKVQQILRYLRAAKISSGIMFMYSLEPRHIQRYDHVFVDHQYPGYMIVEVRPR